MALNRKHKPASPDNPLQLNHIDSTRERIRSAAVKLTDEERELLSDPDWIDEDEADRIMALRGERSQGNGAIPVEAYLKKRGRSLDR